MELLLRTGPILSGSVVWDPSSINNNEEEAKDITVDGAILGDAVIAIFPPVDLEDLQVSGSITSANTVTLVLSNNTGSGVDLGSGTWHVWTIRR